MMSLKVIVLMTASVLFSTFAIGTTFSSVYSQGQEFTASLSGDQEVPPNNSKGKGFAWFKPMGDEISYKINASGIDKITTIHIHGGRAADYGREVIASFETEKKEGQVNGVVGRGEITAYDLMGNLHGKSISDLVSEIQGGNVYVDIHTDAFPNGEIRGLISSMNGTLIDDRIS
jgi:hypothetical protein